MKQILKHPFVQTMLAFVASLYIRFVFATGKWQRFGFDIPQKYLDQKKPFITCFWHARLLMLPYAWPGKKGTFHMLISAHKDGRLISKTVGFFGIHTVAGSTNKKGMEALLRMVRLSRAGHTLGITPDGPRGPGYEVSDGTVMAAYLTKADLIPVTYSVKRHKRFATWDRFFLPWPFSRGVLMWGDPVPYPSSKTKLKTTQVCLKKAMDDLCDQADQRVQA